MDNAERKKRDSLRISYLETEIEDWISCNKNTFLTTVSKRVLKIGDDVFGSDGAANKFLESVLNSGSPHPENFGSDLLYYETSLIDQRHALNLGINLSYELLRVHNCEIQYYIENNLYGLWENLEAAGMSHDNIGQYFESFD